MNKQEQINAINAKIAELQAEVDKLNKVEKWEPNEYITGYYVDSYGEVCQGFYYKITSFGNSFQTKKQAEEASYQMCMTNRLRQYVLEFDNGWKADWSDCSQRKAHIYTHRGKWYYAFDLEIYRHEVIYMSEQTAKELVDKLNSGEVELDGGVI